MRQSEKNMRFLVATGAHHSKSSVLAFCAHMGCMCVITELTKNLTLFFLSFCVFSCFCCVIVVVVRVFFSTYGLSAFYLNPFGGFSLSLPLFHSFFVYLNYCVSFILITFIFALFMLLFWSWFFWRLAKKRHIRDNTVTKVLDVWHLLLLILLYNGCSAYLVFIVVVITLKTARPV